MDGVAAGDALPDVTRRGALALGAAGISSLAVPSSIAAASVLTSSVPFDSFSVEAVEDRTIRVTWVESGSTDTVEYRVQGDGDDDWVAVEGLSSPADVVTTASWGTTDTSVPYEFRIVTSSGGASVATAPRSVTSVAAASGGVIDLISVGGVLHRVHMFDSTSGGTLQMTYARDVEYLVVGGGGGGGSHVGGGGGGGGVRTGRVAVAAGAAVAVTVGAGGDGGRYTRVVEPKVVADNVTNTVAPTDGGSSSFGAVTALGGGRGGSWSTVGPAAGGSGGAAAGAPAGPGPRGRGTTVVRP